MSKKFTPMPNRVIGVDPGFGRCGIAILEKNKLLFSTCIITNAKAKAIHPNPNAYKIIYNLYKPLKIIKYICNITYYN